MGLGGKAELIGLPEKPVDLNMKGGIIIIKKYIYVFIKMMTE